MKFIYSFSNNICRFENILYIIRMSGKAAIEKVKQNADIARQTIEELKNELNIIEKEYNIILARQLKEENARLIAAVEEAKKKLICLEVQNGVKQIPVPNPVDQLNLMVTDEKLSETIITAPPSEKKEQPKKEKKDKKPKETLVEAPINVGRLDLRIGQVEDVQRHPDADTLYVLKINCGEEKQRTVCSGLVKHIPIDELQNRTVVLLCNLKPVKMRGITSEAMVMCASSEAGVEVLNPPIGVVPGDLVNCEGFERKPDLIMNPKKKIFEAVSPDLHTNNSLQACYKNVPLEVKGKGFCTSKTLKNVPVK